MENRSIINNKSFAFALRIVKLNQYLASDKKEYVMSKQLLRSGTSIGANVNEALQGFSKKDFTYKMNISLKEAFETDYWLRLLNESGYINNEEFKSVNTDCTEIIRILTAIVKTSKSNDLIQKQKQ